MKFLTLFFAVFLLSACLEERLAFTVEAAPVRADIVRLDDAPAGSIAYSATFAELDKSGILDQNVGVVATPIAGLTIRILAQDQSELATLVTDGEGRVRFEAAVDDLAGVRRLEWTGTYADRPFRVLRDL